jgi:CheY-like chemotaxis protein
MPGMNGIELCQKLKEDWDTQDIPVLFLSGSDDLDTRLLCYDAGGDDFTIKPFEPAELLRKLNIAGRSLAQKKALHEQAGYAQRTAMSAMVSMGELGVVLQFLSKSFACNSEEELGAAMLEAMQQYELQAAIQLRTTDRVYSVSPHGVDSPLEAGILNLVRDSGRIFQFKSRCVFNYGRITLMVNNMPLEDADKAGRIRDNCALLAEGADARLQAVEAERASRRRQSAVVDVLPKINAALATIRESYQRNCFEQTHAMIEYQENLLRSFVSLGLTDRQEETLVMGAKEFAQRMAGIQDSSIGIADQLEEVATALARIVKD